MAKQIGNLYQRGREMMLAGEFDFPKLTRTHENGLVLIYQGEEKVLWVDEEAWIEAAAGLRSLTLLDTDITGKLLAIPEKE
jgi:hypothetical protein